MWTPAINGGIETYLEDEKYILVSNNDIVYHPDTVRKLRTVAARPETGMVAPIGSALGGNARLRPPITGKVTGSGTRTAFVQNLPDLRVAYVVGASVMFRTDVYREVGPWDNEMPLGADDHDYCIQLKEHDYHIMVCQSAYVAHKGHASGQRAKSVWDEWAGKSWEVFNKKWAGYFSSKEEAIKCHWAAEYHPGWEKGTGWLSPEERSAVWDIRNDL